MKKKIVNSIRDSLIKIENLDKEKTDALIHALVDIQESFEKIYKTLLPRLVKEINTKERVQDLLWDIREEFRHIDYHIRDSDILDL